MGLGGGKSPFYVGALIKLRARAVSSAVEHSPHTGGATGSIPVPPTTSFAAPGRRVSLSTIHGACTDGSTSVPWRALHVEPPRALSCACLRPAARRAGQNRSSDLFPFL